MASARLPCQRRKRGLKRSPHYSKHYGTVQSWHHGSNHLRHRRRAELLIQELKAGHIHILQYTTAPTDTGASCRQQAPPLPQHHPFQPTMHTQCTTVPPSGPALPPPTAVQPLAFSQPLLLFDLTGYPPPTTQRPQPFDHYPGLIHLMTSTLTQGHHGRDRSAPAQHYQHPFGPPSPPLPTHPFFQAPHQPAPFSTPYAAPTSHPGIHNNIGARLMTLLAKYHLTTEDMNRLQVLNACQDYNKATPPTTGKGTLNLRLFFALGWANLPQEQRDILDHANTGVWLQYDQATTKAGRMDLIETYIILQLTNLNPCLTTCLHHDWKSAIKALDLAPQSHATGRVKCGLRPLAYVAHSMEQIQTADM